MSDWRDLIEGRRGEEGLCGGINRGIEVSWRLDEGRFDTFGDFDYGGCGNGRGEVGEGGIGKLEEGREGFLLSRGMGGMRSVLLRL